MWYSTSVAESRLLSIALVQGQLYQSYCHSPPHTHTQRPGYGDQLVVEQLSKDHNTANDEELRRLAECGLDPTELRRARRLGYQQNTRSIGDYSIKGGYADVESIR